MQLPRDVARHAQVLRLQPGDAVVLFGGDDDCEWHGRITTMARDAVGVEIAHPVAVRRELPRPVTLAIGMPTNERMDTLIEKATELGAARIIPLVSTRSVLRLDGDRARARQARWQSIARSASEQCGRTRLPVIDVPAGFDVALRAIPPDAARWLLSLEPDALPIAVAAASTEAGGVVTLSGPEGGLSPEEIAIATAAGFVAVGLGPRVLRADTAPLAALMAVAAMDASR